MRDGLLKQSNRRSLQWKSCHGRNRFLRRLRLLSQFCPRLLKGRFPVVFKKLSFQIQGVAPLLMHAANTVDPLNPHKKALDEVSRKKKKTEADHLRMAEIEFKAGLYLDKKKGPVLTPDVILATLVSSAKKDRRGNDAKAGIFCDEAAQLQYDGPRDADKLWADENFRLRCPVRVGAARVMRTRPMFKEWAAMLVITFDDAIFNESDIKAMVVKAGEEVGFCDWRPRFGRFRVLKAV